ncbi:MAG: GIY-YIG nuclease family protein [Candidatus Eisenbacteria bacterium]
MSTHDDRKAKKREYLETPRTVGLFRVCHRESGRWYIGSSADVPAMLNRQRFQLDMGSHPNPNLQRDWRRFGAEAFVFETLDTLSPPESAASWDPRKELQALETMWHERLKQLYGAGYHVEKSTGI